MKAKYALIILTVGYCIDFVATTFKIMHRQYADNLFIVATVFKVIGLIAFVAKLLTHPKTKEFLNR